jgi:hypothetical protein
LFPEVNKIITKAANVSSLKVNKKLNYRELNFTKSTKMCKVEYITNCNLFNDTYLKSMKLFFLIKYLQQYIPTHKKIEWHKKFVFAYCSLWKQPVFPQEK